MNQQEKEELAQNANAYKSGWLYFTVWEDPRGGFYVDIFDRQGKDVDQLPHGEGELFSSRQEARTAAVSRIQELEAKSRELASLP